MLNFIQRIFQRKRPSAALDVRTAPLSEEQLKSVSVRPVQLKPPQLIVGSAQSVGRQRDHNEDALFTLSSVLSDGTTELNFGIFVVADGMGGHEYGEVASGVAIRAMSGYLLKNLYPPYLSLDTGSQGDSLQEIMEKGVFEAQQAVLRNAPGGGTTLTAAFVLGEQVTIAHVGDSRSYFLYPDGRIQVVTQDHSLVRRLVELNQITEEQASVHPRRNVLYRALGQTEPFHPDVNTHLLPHPGYMLLCSDGLWGVVPEPEIFRIITKAPSPSVACHELVEAANAAGGPDNITAVLVQYLNTR